MTRTTIFRSNGAQAVRLGKDVGFADDVKEVTILCHGRQRVIVPSDAVWDEFFARQGSITVFGSSPRRRTVTRSHPRNPSCAALERRGEVIGRYDLLIAGHARSRGLVHVTGNLGETSRVDGLRCEDWEAT